MAEERHFVLVAREDLETVLDGADPEQMHASTYPAGRRLRAALRDQEGTDLNETLRSLGGRQGGPLPSGRIMWSFPKEAE